MKIVHVVGARPNFIKIAPVIREMEKHPDRFRQILVHTGQHYDEKMSRIFFEDLQIPRPDVDLGVGSGSHAEQTASILVAFEKVLLKEKPDLVLVVGDVNSTLACSLAASKLWIPVAHVEAGLRSNDRTMPEEINRILTDQIADWLFTTEREAEQNLLREGVAKEKIHFVGNVMIDTLMRHRERALALKTFERFGMKEREFALLTLHRPSNVDYPEIMAGILEALGRVQERMPILFPAHPRTQKRIQEFGLQDSLDAMPNLKIIDPIGYLEFLSLTAGAGLVLTDSGGIQEETTILEIPCLTLRANTERPITVTEGSNQLVGSDPEKIWTAARDILDGKVPKGRRPEYWDGRAAERIVAALS